MTYGSAYREQIVDKLRRAAEHCDCLQCFFLVHSMGGGKTRGQFEPIHAWINQHLTEVPETESASWNDIYIWMYHECISNLRKPAYIKTCPGNLGFCDKSSQYSQVSTIFNSNKGNQVSLTWRYRNWVTAESKCIDVEFEVRALAWGPECWPCWRRSSLRCAESSPPSIHLLRMMSSRLPTTAFWPWGSSQNMLTVSCLLKTRFVRL